MKYKKVILTVLCLMAVLSVAILQAACKKPQENSSFKEDSSSGISGGDNISYFYVIEGATDFYVDLSATKSSIDISSITAYRENGEGTAENVFMDDSNVTWGKQGVYSVKYIAGESFIEKKIYIYGNTLPTLTGAKNKTIKNANEVLSGVSATDQFGFSLAVGYFINGTESARLVAGENIVTYKASDLVGNTVQLSVVITLE